MSGSAWSKTGTEINISTAPCVCAQSQRNEKLTGLNAIYGTYSHAHDSHTDRLVHPLYAIRRRRRCFSLVRFGSYSDGYATSYVTFVCVCFCVRWYTFNSNTQFIITSSPQKSTNNRTATCQQERSCDESAKKMGMHCVLEVSGIFQGVNLNICIEPNGIEVQ